MTTTSETTPTAPESVRPTRRAASTTARDGARRGRVRVLPFGVAAAAALLLAGCTPSGAPESGATTGAATASVAASPTATEASAAPTASAAPAEWTTTAFTDVAECQAIEGIVSPQPGEGDGFTGEAQLQPMWTEEDPEYNGPVSAELLATGVTPVEGCHWQSNTYVWSAVHVGTLPEPIAPGDELFTTFEGSGEGVAYPADYEQTPMGAGTAYLATSICNELFGCDVVHYVEGDVLVTFVQESSPTSLDRMERLVAHLRG